MNSREGEPVKIKKIIISAHSTAMGPEGGRGPFREAAQAIET